MLIHVVLMLTSIFSMIFIRKGKKFVTKQGQPQPHVHGRGYGTKLITVKWSIAMEKEIVINNQYII